jgi:His/Glu/Gln/Arg/opine family amino acid ABC transporter permease subunit
MEFRFGILSSHLGTLADGAVVTLVILVIALATGVVGGAVVCAGRLSPSTAVRRVAAAYVTFFRVTPEMILIFWAYNCIPPLVGIRVSGLVVGSLTLGLVAAAYLGEIYRAGIEALPRGQFEAARALGLSRWPLWGRVILPQSLRLMVPAFVNYFTEIVKNTTLLAAIGVAELALSAYLLGGQTFRYVEFLTAIAFVYFAIIFPFSLLSRRLEARRGH